MSAWRCLSLVVCLAGLTTACAVQPLTPGPNSIALVGDVAAIAAEPTVLPKAPVVAEAAALAVQVVVASPTATPVWPTPIPYLTPTPQAEAGQPALEAPAGGAQPVQPTAAAATLPPIVSAPTEAPVGGAADPGSAPTEAAAVPATETPLAPTATLAAATAPPAVQGPPASGDAAAAEVYMVDLINQQRVAAGAAPLLMDPLLMSVARGRVDDMVARGYTGHNDPSTGAALGPQMMRAAGFTSNFVGENWYGTIKPPPTNVEVAMGWFMTDPPHASNILSPYYAYVGVGLAFNGRQWLIVQNFAGLN
jgi:uncharacterized protein YkwD